MYCSFPTQAMAEYLLNRYKFSIMSLDVDDEQGSLTYILQEQLYNHKDVLMHVILQIFKRNIPLIPRFSIQLLNAA